MTIRFDMQCLSTRRRWLQSQFANLLEGMRNVSSRLLTRRNGRLTRKMSSILGLLVSGHVCAFTIGSDGSFTYMYNEVIPYVNNFYFQFQQKHPWGGEPGDIIVAVGTNDSKKWDISCYAKFRGPEMSISDHEIDEFKTVRRLITENAGKTGFGGPHCSELIGMELTRLRIEIVTTNKPTQIVFTQVVISEIPSDPIMCSASIIGPMDFGVLTGVGPQQAGSSINVTCSQTALIHVNVNHGSSFYEEQSGTEIAFVSSDDSLSGDSKIACNKVCSVRLTGKMISAPTSPGSYRWSVPVIVEYQ